MRASRFWKREKTLLCRICGNEKETWEHVWENCTEWMEEKGSWQEVVGWILREEGKGEWWMRLVEEERRKVGRPSEEEGTEKRERES